LGKCLKWFLLNYLPSKMGGGQHILEEDVFPIGSRVYVANDSPFRGRKGIILGIHMIANPGEPTFCFYLVALDGTQLQEHLWFEYHEVELVGLSCEQNH
jgi:hypothetical protein